jgi:hypothetical protein
VGRLFLSLAIGKRVETRGPGILISSRYEELGGNAGICDVPGLGEFSGLPAPITAYYSSRSSVYKQCNVRAVVIAAQQEGEN